MAVGGTVLFVQGDDLPTITLSLRDRNSALSGRVLDASDSDSWAPLRLADAVVTAKVRRKGDIEITDTLTATILDVAAARIMLEILTGAVFVATAGDYEVELTVTYQYGSQQTVYDWLLFRVRERIA